ncbi:MAG: tRNA (N(6)-L-threonylcarbamoyladenosine(37)-C(2))-methylthiotransferase MtaB [Bacteroidales bacterium]|nr:tRNA (N(6)-L-threonylcarbamoyladenosine(37)-C(2))-methylthiotransferase MtaB [Bacteroidales bacterium]
MDNTVAFVTLGCKLNYAETSTMARSFEERGYRQVDAASPADIYVINTCSVTEHADKKCRNIIRRLHKVNPQARIVVTGCYAQLKPEEISALEGVYAVLGAKDKGRTAEIAIEGKGGVYNTPRSGVSGFMNAYSFGERTRSFLKVQDGCDYFCTYCTVPLARGASRNLPIADLRAQAEEIAAKGIKEIVLTGVNTGDFGRSTGESFLDLLKVLNEVEGIERYRISSIEPNLLTDEIIDWIASGTKFLPHFHIPLQSGCDKILTAMHRRYDTEFFANKIAYIRSRMDNVFFGIDVIAGFPGETDEDFLETYRFLERIAPAFIHIFPYSRRAGTVAAAIKPQVQECIKTRRVEMLEELCERLHSEFCKANEGRREQVLFESTDKGGKMFGYTRNYIMVERPYDSSLIGRIADVVLP